MTCDETEDCQCPAHDAAYWRRLHGGAVETMARSNEAVVRVQGSLIGVTNWIKRAGLWEQMPEELRRDATKASGMWP